LHGNWEAVEIALNKAKQVRVEHPDLASHYQPRARGRSAYSRSSFVSIHSNGGNGGARHSASTAVASPFSGLDAVAIAEVTAIQDTFDDRTIVIVSEPVFMCVSTNTFLLYQSTFTLILSTFNCQLSTVNFQLSTVNCQLSTVNFQLSTVNFQLSTFNFVGADPSTEPRLRFWLLGERDGHQHH
jgi:hypothetical protein